MHDHLIAPLDDSYIHFQYARSLAQGMFMRFNPQDPPTSGGTSLLYPVLLAFGFKLGASGDNIVWWAWTIGIAAYFALVQAAFTLARTFLLHLRLPWTSGETPLPTLHLLSFLVTLLVALNGAVLWSLLSGMESTLIAALSIITLTAVASERKIFAAVLAGVCAFVRPEGSILAVLIAAWLVLARPLQRGRIALAGIAFSSVLAQPLLNLAYTGRVTATGFLVKSWIYNVPFYPDDIARSIVLWYTQLWRDLIIGLREWGWVMPPLLAAVGLLFFTAVGIQCVHERRRCGFALVTLGWLLLGMFSVSLLQTATWHYGRYQLNFICLLVIGGASALAQGVLTLPRHWRWIAGALVLLWLGGGMIATALYAHRNVLEATRVTQAQVVAMSQWLKENTPPDARIGAHDVGVIRYRSDRYVYDVVGLGSPDTAYAWRTGAGAVYEQMERSPNRPTWFATYPDVWAFGYFENTNVFARLRATFPVPNTDTVVIVSAGEQRIYEADWSLLNSGDQLYQPDIIARLQGLRLVDHIDIADLVDEQAHEYRWWNLAKLPGFASEAKQLPYRVPPHDLVMDGGRLLTGGEEMTVRTQPNTDLWLVMRVHPQNGAKLRVFADGAFVGVWTYPQLAGYWLETLFQVPATFVKSDHVRVRVEAVTDDPGFRYHAPFYYWFYQGTAAVTQPVPSHPLTATLGDTIALVGYDLITNTLHPGQTFTVTLYWRAMAPIQNSYKVFVHIAAADGTVQAQHDSAPVFDTRTTNTWRVGEMIVDEHQIVIPPEQSPGDYQLTCGLYLDTSPLTRLPVQQMGQPVTDKALLMTVKVR